ncbi:MAG: hypothetical protein CMB81_00880 [Flammeovirgaceae bacterium]|jgi:hypothetical protein|nr:hypothetical protein [Flammeovirgaceae bacterium]|tara:strand:- start:317 stop:1213 length:897 start_codon:yes stop_codon:yes gene_type:complete
MIRVYILLLLICLTPLYSYTQELNSKVLVNTEKLQSSEKLLFEEMESSIEQFLNNQIWTGDKFNTQEKINCNFIINIINEPSSNQYEATVQILSSRPIYNSSYETILLNHGDREWIFEYFPSQTIEFVENGFNDNLTSLLSFYAYMIIGIDYDSFEEKGGEESFKLAWKILNTSQNSGYKGWDQFGSRKNRYWICENFLNPEFERVRKAIYSYHIKGMDKLYLDPIESRSTIMGDINSLNDVNKKNFNSAIVNLFIDAKADELTKIFKGGSLNERRQVFNLLSEISPSNIDVFNKILE